MKNKKVAIFVSQYSVGISSSILNLIKFLSEGYHVDLYLSNVSLTNTTVIATTNIRIIQINRIFPLRGLFGRLKNNQIEYEFSICFDPHGFVLCREILPHSKPFYYSLELYTKKDHYGLYYPTKVMEYERNEINTISGLIIQSEEKDKIFRIDYSLSDDIPTFILPVTYTGPPVKQKGIFVHEKLKIPLNKKVALHLGGISWWFSCIEISAIFSTVDDWVLVFQGYPNKKYLKKFKTHLLKNNIQNVYILDEVYDSIEEVDPIIQSCSLGIAWYNDISIGFRTAGKSSGKIPAYLRFGLPVIAKKYKSTIESIESTGCGLCVEHVDEIRKALEQINKNYTYYSNNALCEYKKTYLFENYSKGLLNFLLSNTSISESSQAGGRNQ